MGAAAGESLCLGDVVAQRISHLLDASDALKCDPVDVTKALSESYRLADGVETGPTKMGTL